MTRTITRWLCLTAVALAASAVALADKRVVPDKERQSKLIAVLKSTAPLKEKADACRELAVIGDKDAVAPLAELLGDEQLSYHARYGLEPNPDPGVDDAFRAALAKLKGRPLVGVIGSIGVRRDAKAVGPLSDLLKNDDPQVAQAAARAVGRIGSPDAIAALEGALGTAPAANRLALCEGLLRCSDGLAKHGKITEAVAILDRLNRPEAPPQVREGAARKARFLRAESGPTL
jgi:HEAT repeat protein